MHKQIFVNLAVEDLQKSRAFFGELGFSFNPKFSNDQAAGMVISENIYAMLLVKPFFQTFTSKTIIDPKEQVEALTCLSCESRAEVDDIVAKAVRAGGKAPRPPQDYGFMYSHGFDDLDGHTWEFVYMDPNAAGAP
ncbi:extradiol dioxygenase [Caballeronia mineralivorans PML1(12)]|uniref:Extradiol dioxygenase n=1 Tax=Caballeronia mineralivorans PML1(12) TaxID=908627 RepID=A0A0J1CKI5_9BURK|nr:VOC family protein [Caballeronia mineralivorans]KLU20946.1 extradiol dioxygenase [Caballeronia mineralivorans PML1(12)]